MELTHIAVTVILALLYSALLPGRWRGWALLIVSIVAIYWLGTPLAIRNLDFILPTATLVLAGAVWLFTLPADARPTRQDGITLGVAGAVVLAIAATRYLDEALRPTPTRPPDVLPVALGLLIAGGAVIIIWRALRNRQTALLYGGIAAILLIFVVLKLEPLTVEASRALRELSGQQPDLARAADIAWLGFSYVAFRLIHLLRDRQTGRLPLLTLQETLAYTIFFPAFTAGPIDRAERFQKDWLALPQLTGLDAARWTEGITRVAVGICKKFVFADSLVLLSLNAANAGQADSAPGLWLLLYGFGIRLWLDFAGYSDIAIGLGFLFGIRLPENFDRPYLQHNLVQFWQRWHKTLSDWARFYVFSPLSRALLTRRRPPKLKPTQVVFVAQLATMLTIGLWHGVSWSFIVWGLWHGIGLFVHKLWSDRTRKWYLGLREKPRLKRAWTAAGVLLTFHFVTLGWVWFALPEIGTAAQTFARLFGMGF
ncbi:MAG: hypothetical protein JW910_20375 [Anaerolineae bacterium]|nr:hypothetical protein [Anaerolineae bacterium]